MPKTTVLVTGATGYIASHTIVELLNEGYEVIGIDNLANSKKAVISRITSVTQRSINFRTIDLRDYKALDKLFSEYSIQSVMHFAGYKAVGESMENPMLYYSNNIKASINLIEVMQKHEVKNLVFSSSCTVYGDAEACPITEQSECKPKSPYGRTKYFTEQLLEDICNSDPDWVVTCLRYFNPIGAHASGKIGEDPSGIPNNLMPYISQVALGKRDKVSVFGGDYNTPDGTCIRDYIHVTDLAKGHIAALESFSNNGFETINLGTGKGYSVLDVIRTFEKVTGVPIPYEIVDRRAGDAESVWADPNEAYRKLYWQAELDLEHMCSDTWFWQLSNPNGYETSEIQTISSELQSHSSVPVNGLTKISRKAVSEA